jgi:hypothetical protein
MAEEADFAFGMPAGGAAGDQTNAGVADDAGEW